MLSWPRSSFTAMSETPLITKWLAKCGGGLSPDVKRDAVKLLDAPTATCNGNLTATEPAR